MMMAWSVSVFPVRPHARCRTTKEPTPVLPLLLTQCHEELALCRRWWAPSSLNLLPSLRTAPFFFQPAGVTLVSVHSSPNDQMLWALDSRWNVYVRSGITEEMPVGTDWEHVPGRDGPRGKLRSPSPTVCHPPRGHTEVLGILLGLR